MNAVHRVLDPADGIQVPPGLCALAVMTKAPRPGLVKTRLTPPLTPEEAAALNVCFLRDTSASISAAVGNGGGAGIASYTPVGAEGAWGEILPGHFVMVAQRGDDFGERLSHAVEDLLRIGFYSVCLIDSDSPMVPQRTYKRAMELLAKSGDRVVLGPSDDGGYYLIGLKRLHPRLFEEIDWSTERVLAQTKARAAEIGLPVESLPTEFDVDDGAGLRRLCDDVLVLGLSSANHPAPETHAFLSNLIAREGRGRIWPNEE